MESTLFWPKNTFLSETNTFNAGELFGHIVHLAFDSAGAITPQSAVFINKLYAALDDGDVPRERNSEAERIHLKKFFIDSLSISLQNRECVIYAQCVMPRTLYILTIITHTIRLMKEEQIYVLERLVFDRLIFL